MCDDDRLWAAISIGSLLCIRALSTRLLRNNMLNPTQTRKRHVFPFDRDLADWELGKHSLLIIQPRFAGLISISAHRPWGLTTLTVPRGWTSAFESPRRLRCSR